ncbi:hypothetical protein ACOME3_006611 [Neoechinorhynchus agilis]
MPIERVLMPLLFLAEAGKSQTCIFPEHHGRKVAPSGRLQSFRESPTGSSRAGEAAVERASSIMRLTAECCAWRAFERLQSGPLVPDLFNVSPHRHVYEP